MLSSYDLTGFAKKLRTIRKSLGYSQTDVSFHTGINSDTLRRLENGLSIPRYDTLEVLSLFYKENLALLLDSYKISSHLSYFYDRIDYYMVNEDFKSLTKTISDFESFISNNTVNLVDHREIEQLKLFFDSLAMSYSDDSVIRRKAINNLIHAINITIPNFQLEKWENFKFNFFELRILFTIASIEGGNKNCKISNDIILNMMNYLDFSPLSKFTEKMLIVKSFCIVSYNFHRLDEHDQALEYAEKGLKYCFDQSILAYIHLLLFRKGVALYNLYDSTFTKYIEQSIQLLLMQERNQIADSYSKHLERLKSEFIDKK